MILVHHLLQHLHSAITPSALALLDRSTMAYFKETGSCSKQNAALINDLSLSRAGKVLSWWLKMATFSIKGLNPVEFYL